VIVDFAPAKLKRLRKRARKIGAKVLTGQTPNPRLGTGAGTYLLVDAFDGEPLRPPGGANLTLLGTQITAEGVLGVARRNRLSRNALWASSRVLAPRRRP
jgi:hypothetical protein